MMASSIEMLSECPVCFCEMVPPMKIFQCLNGHALCEECKDNEHVRTCPSCRVTLEGNAISRNILAEKMIETAMSGMTTHDNIPSAPPLESDDEYTTTPQQQNNGEDVAEFLARLNLSEVTKIFEEQEFDMEDVVNLSNEDLKDIGVNKLKHRKLILEETQKLRKGSSRPAEPEPVRQSESESATHASTVPGMISYRTF